MKVDRDSETGKFRLRYVSHLTSIFLSVFALHVHSYMGFCIQFPVHLNMCYETLCDVERPSLLCW